MDIKPGRYTASYPDEFVVFLIGMRINQLWRVNEWLPVFRGALAMQKETLAMPDSPLLESRSVVSIADWRMVLMIQYWRSFDELESWANNADLRHRPAQKQFFRRTALNGHVGVWHETFRVAAGEYEAIYLNLHRFGLAAAGEHIALRTPSTARERLEDRPLPRAADGPAGTKRAL